MLWPKIISSWKIGVALKIQWNAAHLLAEDLTLAFLCWPGSTDLLYVQEISGLSVKHPL